METVCIYPLPTLHKGYARRLREARMEAARVWTVCRDQHLAARQQHTRWPTRDDLQQATKGQFALHSQTVQMVCHQFLANVDTTRELRQTNRNIRYPYKDKRYYPLFWPAQAVSRERGRIVLPMGRGHRSLVFKLDLPEHLGGCKLVWKDGYELHVSVPATPAETTSGPAKLPSTWAKFIKPLSPPTPAPRWWCPGAASGPSNGGTTWRLDNWRRNANAVSLVRGGRAGCGLPGAR